MRPTRAQQQQAVAGIVWLFALLHFLWYGASIAWLTSVEAALTPLLLAIFSAIACYCCYQDYREATRHVQLPPQRRRGKAAKSATSSP